MIRIKELGADVIAITILCFCIGIVLSCSVAGYSLAWNEAMKHWEKAVGEEAARRIANDYDYNQYLKRRVPHESR